jgi:hypothetical protein
MLRPLALLSLLLTAPALAQDVDFDLDVRPILSDKCYACHGPDAQTRKAGLRLDTQEGASGTLRDGRFAVVAGSLDESELWQRVTHAERAARMPPADQERQLVDADVDVLRRWILQGAQWAQHWSLVPPTRPEPPAVQDAAWCRGAVDRFLLARLEAAGLAPEREADAATLLRRVTLDLTGLPPTRAELDAFLADEREDAYERVVERLLASPRYGEHMARVWLDAARYADTHGLHLDNERSMWPWRAWVIDAYNQNKPFDEFTIEQLAGDLLEDATLEQRVASGFNRCNPTSAEGGMIAAEYLSIYAKDRVDTTSTVWMGLTMGCAQCHDHKFDPLTQRDYYAMYAFFNNLTEEASDRNIANPQPFTRTPDAEEQARLGALDARVAELAEVVAAPMPEVDAQQAAWEEEWAASLARRWQVAPPERFHATHGTTLAVEDGGVVAASGENPHTEVYELDLHTDASRITAIKLDALCDVGQPVPGRATNANFVLSKVEVTAWPARAFEQAAPIALASAHASHSQDEYGIAGVLDDDPQSGWGGLGLEGARSAVLVAREPFGWENGTDVRVTLRFESVHAQHAFARLRLSLTEDERMSPARLGRWRAHPRVGEDAGRAGFATVYPPEQDLEAAGWEERDYPDGQVHLFEAVVGTYYLHRTIEVPAGRDVQVGIGSDDALKVFLNGAEVHANDVARAVALDADRVTLPLRAGRNDLVLKVVNTGGASGFAFRVLEEHAGGFPADVALALGTPPDARAAAQNESLRTYFRRNHAPEWIALDDELSATRKERADYENSLPTTMVSEERMQRRPAHVLVRGRYDVLGDEVQPATPAALPPLPAGAPRDRLGLARWLVSREHPLTARVAVNRLWQSRFGTGLVKTSEDFGVQGQRPSHPALLDWLAVEFMDSGWDVQHMLRLMVTSSAYRQSARVEPRKLELDPYNRLLARGPRYRLDAEQIRDQALFVSGLLVERLGGESVKPFQPPGIWFAVGYSGSNTVRFEQDSGDALYRRSLYTFWKRTAPPPNLATFDAPSREATCVRRERTNTPLQALVLLNDPQYVEAARFLAERMLAEGGETDERRAAFGFRLVTAREPSAWELAQLTEMLAEERARFAADGDGARALLAVGDKPADARLEPAEHAAHTLLANLLLNLDETISKH